MASNTATASPNSVESASDSTPTADQERIDQKHESLLEAQQVVFDLNCDAKEFIYQYKKASGLFVGRGHKVRVCST